MKTLIGLSSFLLLFNIYAKEYTYSSYEDASKGKEFVKFESESTKLGFITTSFDGYAKKFNVDYRRDGQSLKDIQVTIKADSFDTDNSSRDEKMYEETLSVKKYPEIKFLALSNIDLNKQRQQVKGLLKVRNVEKDIIINVELVADGEWKMILGKTKLSLKNFSVPDPSIAIANVRDEFDISFKVRLNE